MARDAGKGFGDEHGKRLRLVCARPTQRWRKQQLVARTVCVLLFALGGYEVSTVMFALPMSAGCRCGLFVANAPRNAFVHETGVPYSSRHTSRFGDQEYPQRVDESAHLNIYVAWACTLHGAMHQH